MNTYYSFLLVFFFRAFDVCIWRACAFWLLTYTCVGSLLAPSMGAWCAQVYVALFFRRKTVKKRNKRKN